MSMMDCAVPPPDRGPVDASLVEAARRGDRASFAELVERHRELALALAGNLLGNRNAAADVVQEAAVTALVGLERLRTPAKFGPWFSGIALNLARRWWRDARRTSVVSAAPYEFGDDPEELAVRDELAARIRAAVRHLPPGQRNAVLAFYWKGLSHAEAAAELGVSPGAVKARLHQARASLAPRLAEYSPDRPGSTTTALPASMREEIQMPDTDTPPVTREWIEADVEEVHRSRDAEDGFDFHAVVLRQRGGERRAAIYVGQPEATALAFSLETVETPRPMTYAMTAQLVQAAGARVADVRITHMDEPPEFRTVFAVVRVEMANGVREVDARPSDALNLALLTGAPVLVESSVFDELETCALRDWQEYPDRARDLVSETQERQSKMMASAAAAMQRRQEESAQKAAAPKGR